MRTFVKTLSLRTCSCAQYSRTCSWTGCVITELFLLRCAQTIIICKVTGARSLSLAAATRQRAVAPASPRLPHSCNTNKKYYVLISNESKIKKKCSLQVFLAHPQNASML